MCKTNKRKNFKSVKGLQRNVRKFILKNSQFFCEYLEIKAETKKMQKGKSWSPITPKNIYSQVSNKVSIDFFGYFYILHLDHKFLI